MFADDRRLATRSRRDRTRTRRATSSGSPGQPPNRDFWFGTTDQGYDVFSQVVWGARTVARRRRCRGDPLDVDRRDARDPRRLPRRLDRRRDQHRHQHLPRHPDAAAADRDRLLRGERAARDARADPRPDDVGDRGAHPARAGAVAPKPRLRARGEGGRRVRRGGSSSARSCPNMVSRIAAAFLLVFYISILFEAGLEFLGLGRRQRDELGRDDVLGAEQLGRSPGRVVALRLPGLRARARRSPHSCSSTTESTSCRTRACAASARGAAFCAASSAAGRRSLARRRPSDRARP